MKIEKLPSGTYRVRKTINKKTYTLMYEHKPKISEIETDLAETVRKVEYKPVQHMTFKEAAEKYTETKKNVLKVNTYREYKNTCNRLPQWFVDMNLYEITQININQVVNELALNKQAKTVRNYHAFISSVLGTFRPDFKIYTTLPKKKPKTVYIPSDEEIKMILDELIDTEFYIPVVLASYGMRRGEICALEVSDIEGDIVHITKSLALNEDKQWVIDTPKTIGSTRDIIIPMKIADMIREQGYVYNGHPNSISDKLTKIEKKLGIKHFSVHKLRHYFASTLASKNVPTPDIMALGGWETDNVLKSIYTHSLIEQNNKKRQTMQKINDSLFS